MDHEEWWIFGPDCDWTIQLLIAAGMVIMTALKDGLAAAMAAIYAVCCFLPHQVNKVRRQAARKRASAPPEELLPNAHVSYCEAAVMTLQKIRIHVQSLNDM